MLLLMLLPLLLTPRLVLFSQQDKHLLHLTLEGRASSPVGFSKFDLSNFVTISGDSINKRESFWDHGID
jgi:hypothetical protein